MHAALTRHENGCMAAATQVGFLTLRGLRGGEGGSERKDALN